MEPGLGFRCPLSTLPGGHKLVGCIRILPRSVRPGIASREPDYGVGVGAYPLIRVSVPDDPVLYDQLAYRLLPLREVVV
jgi:hypothetical protein